MNVQIVILAAGQGKRMGNPELPKALTLLQDKPMIIHLLDTISQSQTCARPIIVIGHQAELVKSTLGPDYLYAHQPQQLGTGHAVSCALPHLPDEHEVVLILCADKPFIKPQTIQAIVQQAIAEQHVLTMATITVPDFDHWRTSYHGHGRIVRDEAGNITKIVEKKDADEEQLEITELNPSCYCFRRDWLIENVPLLDNNNSQNEYYITDLLGIAFEQGHSISSIAIDPEEGLGINNPEQLEMAIKVIFKK